MAGTTSSTLDDFKSVLIAEARYISQNKANLANVVRQVNFAPGQASVRVPVIPAQTAASLTEGNALSNTAVSSGGVLLDPAVVGWYTILTDNAAFNDPSTAAQLGKAAADAIIAKQVADLFTAGASFTATAGGAGTDISVAVIRAARKKASQLNLVNPILAMTPEVVDDLLADYANASAGSVVISDNFRTAVANGEMPAIYGIRLLEVTSGISETGDIVCPLFDPNALAIGRKWDFKVELQRAAEYVGTKLVVSSCYDAKLIDAAGGVSITCDGTD